MAGRKVVLAEGEYYHIFNRGIARQPIFFNKLDYQRFLLTLKYYRLRSPPMKLSRLLELPLDRKTQVLKDLDSQINGQLVEIISFVLMPNHFHLLLRQVSDKGISIFLNKTGNSYTRYLNTKIDRVGDLFQGVFKAVHVESDEQLLHLTRYIHLNPLVSFILKTETELRNYPWSSLPEYENQTSGWINTEIILGNFSSRKAYIKFIMNQAEYAKKIGNIKHLLLEY